MLHNLEMYCDVDTTGVSRLRGFVTPRTQIRYAIFAPLGTVKTSFLHRLVLLIYTDLLMLNASGMLVCYNSRIKTVNPKPQTPNQIRAGDAVVDPGARMGSLGRVVSRESAYSPGEIHQCCHEP